MQNFDANFSEVIQLLIAVIHTGIKYKMEMTTKMTIRKFD